MCSACINPEPGLIAHPAFLGNRGWPGCRVRRIGLHSLLHSSILQAMLHIPDGEYDQANNDQTSQGPDPLRLWWGRATYTPNYALEVGIGEVPLLCTLGRGDSIFILCFYRALFVCHELAPPARISRFRVVL
jgi:hypothetical protein